MKDNTTSLKLSEYDTKIVSTIPFYNLFHESTINVSLAHTKCNCKCHIVFAPKYRRQVIYGKIKADIGGIRIMRTKKYNHNKGGCV